MFSLAASSVVGQAVTNELCAYILSLFKIHNYEYCIGNSFFFLQCKYRYLSPLLVLHILVTQLVMIVGFKREGNLER